MMNMSNETKRIVQVIALVLAIGFVIYINSTASMSMGDFSGNGRQFTMSGYHMGSGESDNMILIVLGIIAYTSYQDYKDQVEAGHLLKF